MFYGCEILEDASALDNWDISNVENMDMIQIGAYEVYCRSVDINYYMWNDGDYAYQLAISTKLSEQELISIIEGLRIKE